MSIMKVLCMIPTFNESMNIPDLSKEILDLGPEYEVLVVDDDSPDGTWKIAQALSKNDPRVHVLHRTKNKGRGYSGRDGFQWALDHGYEAVVELDADFSHQPKYIPALVGALSSADMVLGSRHVPGGKDLRDEKWRRLLTRAANFYIRTILGVRVRDCNSGFRAYSRLALEKLNIPSLFAQGPLTVQEILYKAHLAKLRIKEVPIEFIEREKGESTLTLKRIWDGYSGVVKLRFMRLFGKI